MTGLRTILLAGCALLSLIPVRAARCEPIINPAPGWDGIISGLLSDQSARSGPLVELSQIERSITLSAFSQQPYRLAGSGGEISLANYGEHLSLAWPVAIGRQLFALRFVLDENNTHALAATDSSRFNLRDHSTSNTIRIAHNWEAMNFRWGAELHWSYYGTKTLFEPQYELSWGAEGGTRLSFLLYRNYTSLDWDWLLKPDSISGRLGSVTDGIRFGLSFGELFGARITAGFTDDQINRYGTATDNSYALTPSAEQRAVALQLEHQFSHAIEWRLMVRRSDLSGDVELRFAQDSVAKAEDLSRGFTSIGCEIAGALPWKLHWRGRVDYNHLSGSMDGWILDNFPSAFRQAITGGRVFAGNCGIEGIRLLGRMQSERTWGRLGAEFGLVNYNLNVYLLDVYDANSQIRQTRLPIDGFSSGWGGLQAEFPIGRLKLQFEGSQAFLISQRGANRHLLGDDAKISGGWSFSAGIAYRI